MSFLLDTNVLSALRRQARNPDVVAWFQNQRLEDLYLSQLTLGEIRDGIENVRKQNADHAARLEVWLRDTKALFYRNILPITEAVIDRWGTLGDCRKHHPIDALIAATALTHNLVLVTRNTKNVRGTGVELLNPWRT